MLKYIFSSVFFGSIRDVEISSEGTHMDTLRHSALYVRHDASENE